MADSVHYEDGVLARTVVDNGDGTGTVTTYDAKGEVAGTAKVDLPPPPPPSIEEARAVLDSLDVEARLAAVAEKVTPAQAVALAPLLPVWTSDKDAVTVGTLRAHDGVIYEAIQAHTTQADWHPDKVPALWRRWRDPDAGPAAWVQPTGGHDAYRKGDTVTHGGKTWTSTIDSNVWAPGVHGWIGA